MRSVILAAAVAAMPIAAQSQQATCAERGIVVIGLAERYGESATGYGLMADGINMVELYVNQETGTWTILYTSPSGLTCLLVSGEAWASIPQGERL